MKQINQNLTFSIFPAAAWFGLVTGLLEGAGTLAILRWDRSGWLLGAGPQALWIFPLVNLILFLCVAICLWVGLQMISKPGLLRLALAVPAYLCFFDLLSFSARIKPMGCFVLALGLTVQFWRCLQGRQNALILFCRRTTVWLLCFVIAIGIALGAWNRISEAHQVSRMPNLGPESPNVLLIVIDTARADHFSFQGYPRATTPQLERLAQDGSLWERAYATSSWTLPSHASIFTGRYLHEHGADRQPLDSRYATLAEVLAAQGYRTAGFSANTYNVTTPVGLARGFQHWEDYYGNLADMAARTYYVRRFSRGIRSRLGMRNILGRKSAADVNREFLRWLDRPGGRPFFAFLNYFDSHDPYMPPEPFRSHFSGGRAVGGLINSYFANTAPKLTPNELQSEVDAYDATLLYIDHEIGLLMQELERRGLSKNMLLVITSDHGESFGEHGLLLHGNSLYYETLHVPLLLWMPNRIPSGRRFPEVVSNRDIPATVFQLVGAANASSFPGPALELARPASPEAESFAVVAQIEEKDTEERSRPAQHGWLKSLLTQNWQFILHQSGEMELFDLSEDPKQLRNQVNSQERSALVQSLRAKLDLLTSKKSSEARTTKEARNPE